MKNIFFSENFFIHSFFFITFQIHTAVQQPGFVRVKRGIKPAIPSINELSPNLQSLVKSNSLSKIGEIPTDPYFPLQWYLRNTGQNSGKIRLDLNVQAAWDQGITGKNVTTAIMDDGMCKTFFFLYIYFDDRK